MDHTISWVQLKTKVSVLELIMISKKD